MIRLIAICEKCKEEIGTATVHRGFKSLEAWYNNKLIEHRNFCKGEVK